MKFTRALGVLVLLSATGVAALVACSSDETSTSTTSTGSVTVRVTADKGGTVIAPGGKATLAIPPGALAADTDITLNVSAASDGAAGEVLDFGPDGLKFLKPATLTFKSDGITVPEGKSLAVATFEGGGWKALEGSAFAAGTATAPVQHFSKFTLIIVDGKISVVQPQGCTDTVAKFTACGGDPSGTYKIADFCVDPNALGADPFKGSCPTATLAVDVTNDRTITIGNGTLTNSAGTETVKLTSTFPLTCLQAQLGDAGAQATCTSLNSATNVCTDKGSGTCECVSTEVKQKDVSTQTYTVSGSKMTLTDSSNKVTNLEFCSQTSFLWAREVLADGGTGAVVYTLARQ